MPRGHTGAARVKQRPVNVSNGDFGSRFGWYVEIIKRKVAQNWLRLQVDPRTPKGNDGAIYFRVNRQGVAVQFSSECFQREFDS